MAGGGSTGKRSSVWPLGGFGAVGGAGVGCVSCGFVTVGGVVVGAGGCGLVGIGGVVVGGVGCAFGSVGCCGVDVQAGNDVCGTNTLAPVGVCHWVPPGTNSTLALPGASPGGH
jgi:hypothetical protein